PRLRGGARGLLPAGARGERFVSADEPDTYGVSYAGEVRQEVAQDHVFVLTAAPGVNDVVVTATDAAGNATTASLRVHGVEPVELDLAAPASLRAGHPLGLTLALRHHRTVVTSVAGPVEGGAGRRP